MSSRSSSRHGSAAGSRPGSAAGPRPGSSGGPRPGSSGSRPGSINLASVEVDMGALAFVDKRTGKGMMVKSVGGYQITSANTIHGRNGMFTRGLSSCFAVAVIGPGGTIFAHVSAYLGHPRLNSREQAELDAMKKGFAALYKTNKAALDPCTVAIVDGGYTDPSQRQSLMNLIFPQLHSVPHIVYFACEKTPLERHAGHGTVVVMLEPSNKLYVEDKPKL